MSKFTSAQKPIVKSIVATLMIKRIPDNEIMQEVYKQTNKTISRTGLFYIKQSIKKDSYKWYQMLREGEYEYLFEFKSRISEIVDLQRRHYKIIEDHPNSPVIQQSSLSELHRLNITLSNYFDVAPTIVNTTPVKTNQNDNSISISQKDIIV